MPRYKIVIEYDGSGRLGWQKQKDGVSIAGIIEDALFKLYNQPIEIIASGRTDAGVHALGQVAHFDLEKNFPPDKILLGINHYLINSGIAIINCELVNDDFHSRFDAKMRHYQYKILNRRAGPALKINRVWHIAEPLDLAKMRAASRYLIGKYDFSSFRDHECQAKSPVKTISAITIENNQNDLNLILITISARSFLHHMVRNIIGTLALVGKGKIEVEEIPKILQAKDRRHSGPNAPACGLYFHSVDY